MAKPRTRQERHPPTPHSQFHSLSLSSIVDVLSSASHSTYCLLTSQEIRRGIKFSTTLLFTFYFQLSPGFISEAFRTVANPLIHNYHNHSFHLFVVSSIVLLFLDLYQHSFHVGTQFNATKTWAVEKYTGSMGKKTFTSCTQASWRMNGTGWFRTESEESEDLTGVTSTYQPSLARRACIVVDARET